MKFYKRKSFYVLLLGLLILIFVLLGMTMRLTFWWVVAYPKERERLDKIVNSVKDDKESMNEFLKHFDPNIKEFDQLFDYIKTAKRDFMVDRYLGFDVYTGAYMSSVNINGELSGLADFIKIAQKYNLENVEDKHRAFLAHVKSSKLAYLESVQEFISFLAQNHYFNKDVYKLVNLERLILIAQFLIRLLSDEELCSLKERENLLQFMQEDYRVLQSIEDEKVKKAIDAGFGSFDKMLEKHNGYIITTKEKFNVCK